MKKVRVLIVLKSRLALLLILFAFLFSSISCSDNAPAILSVNAVVIYEYDSQSSKPKSRLSVFVQPDNEIERFASLEIEHVDSGYTWIIKNATTISNSGKNYVGSPYLQPYNTNDIPFGNYTVTYTDLSSRSATSTFKLSEPTSFQKKSLADETYSDVLNRKVAREFIFDRVVLEDESGEIVYYGGQKKENRNVEDVQKHYPNARVMRAFRMTSNKNAGILFAPVEVPEYKAEKNFVDDEE